MSVRRDYKSAGTWSAGRRRRRTQTRRNALIVGLLVLLGAGGVLWSYLFGGDRPELPPVASRSAAATTAAATAPEADEPLPPAQTPRYRFYEQLPETRVVIPERETAIATAPAAQLPQGTGHLLQVGAFTSADSAERLRAELTLQGIEKVHVVASSSAAGGPLHLVRIGPIMDAASRDAVRRKLAERNIPVINVAP